MMEKAISMPMHEGRELPIFRMREVDLPEVRYWDVGSQHYILLKIEQTGKRNTGVNAAEGDKGKLEGTFQVLSVRAVGKKPIEIKDIERQEFLDLRAKAMSGEL